METTYFIKGNDYGFGSELYKIVRDGDKMISRDLILHTPKKDQAKFIKEKLEAGFVLDVVPVGTWDPQIVCFEKKHADFYYIANSPEELNKIVAEVFRKQKEDGHYGYILNAQKPEDLGFTKDDIDSLPLSLRADAQKKLDRYHDDLKGFEKFQKDADLFWKCLEDPEKYALKLVEFKIFSPIKLQPEMNDNVQIY